jgi:hypothetical protein
MIITKGYRRFVYGLVVYLMGLCVILIVAMSPLYNTSSLMVITCLCFGFTWMILGGKWITDESVVG